MNSATSLIPQKPVINTFPDHSPEVPEHVEIFMKGSAINARTSVLGWFLFKYCNVSFTQHFVVDLHKHKTENCA